MMESMKAFTKKMQDSGLFRDVQFTTMSHFKIGTVAELVELSKHFGADYILLVNTRTIFINTPLHGGILWHGPHN